MYNLEQLSFENDISQENPDAVAHRDKMLDETKKNYDIGRVLIVDEIIHSLLIFFPKKKKRKKRLKL